jgi:hypothetical protein
MRAIFFNKKTGVKAILSLCMISVTMFLSTVVPSDAAEDNRCYAHGLQMLHNPVNDKWDLIWSDAYEKGGDSDGNWTHDVFHSRLPKKWEVTYDKNGRLPGSQPLIQAPEAQEPASAAVAGNGNYIVTFEDGNDAGEYTLAQRYAVYDKDWHVIRQYPSTIAMGGHSGHASATDQRFVVFYSDGWVDGGGVDQLGTGDDVYVTTLSTEGKILARRRVAVQKKTRDWWPLTAANHKSSMLVWQRYCKGKTYASLCWRSYDPVHNKLGRFVSPKKLKLTYYTYNVTEIPGSDLFVIAGLQRDKKKTCFYLVDKNGKIIDQATHKGAIVRESTPVYANGSLTYPIESGLLRLKLDSGKFGKAFYNTLHNVKRDKKHPLWTSLGTDGYVDKTGKITFFNLGTDQIRVR